MNAHKLITLINCFYFPILHSLCRVHYVANQGWYSTYGNNYRFGDALTHYSFENHFEIRYTIGLLGHINLGNFIEEVYLRLDYHITNRFSLARNIGSVSATRKTR